MTTFQLVLVLVSVVLGVRALYQLPKSIRTLRELKLKDKSPGEK